MLAASWLVTTIVYVTLLPTAADKLVLVAVTPTSTLAIPLHSHVPAPPAGQYRTDPRPKSVTGTSTSVQEFPYNVDRQEMEGWGMVP